MRKRIAALVFRLLGKEPEAVIVTFLTGEEGLASQMAGEIRKLVPDRRHFTVEFSAGSAWTLYRGLRKQFRRYRIGLAPVLFTADPRYRPLRRAAFLLAPRKILAYNGRLERHHLRFSTLLSSSLFLAGVPLDRIFLRPRWWPFQGEASVYPDRHRIFDGRPTDPLRRRIAILTPYFPWPLAHGGAVRIFSLTREMAREFDIYLFAFEEGDAEPEPGPLTGLCAKIVVAAKPRYREPRWSSLRPPEVGEFDAPLMRRLWNQMTAEHRIDLRQVEYTSLASYGGDILVEHDITYDLYRQVYARRPSLAAWWDLWRWRRFERAALKRFRSVVVMSEKDRQLLAAPQAAVIPNGVDMERFQAAPEQPGARLLFIGSFRHFPNIEAFRFLLEQILPRLRRVRPDVEVTIVAGPDPLLHWRRHTGELELPADAGIRLLGYVADVRPLYREANLVLVPTLESAGTNVKVLEALAMERAVISTPSGCGGLGLEHAENIWIAGSAEEFAGGIDKLAGDDHLRRRIAAAGRRHAASNFDWKPIGEAQRDLIRTLLGDALDLRAARPGDVQELGRIQDLVPEGADWPPDSYLQCDCRVATQAGRVCGFIVSRQTAPGEHELLNLVVDPDHRRRGIAGRLVRAELEAHPGAWFLEVRESNAGAQSLYRKLGFQNAGVRKEYYRNPPESAIVMRFFS